MKGMLLLGLFALVLMIGCTQPAKPTATPTPTEIPTVSVIVGTTTPTPSATIPAGCTLPDLKFGKVTAPEEYTYLGKYQFKAEVLFDKGTCPDAPLSATVTLNDGNRKLGEEKVSPIADTNTIYFDFIPDETREYSLTLKVDSDAEEAATDNNEYKFGFTVTAFGFNSDISGDVAYEITSNKAYAQGFVLQEKLAVKSIGLYIKKGSDEINNYDIRAEIRSDANSKPSGSSEVIFTNGIVLIGREYGWLKFENPSKTTLLPGRYWLVVKATSFRPPVYLHAVKDAIFQKAEYSMKSVSDTSSVEKWEVHKEGVFNFRIENEAPPVIDRSAGASATPPGSPNDLNPFA